MDSQPFNLSGQRVGPYQLGKLLGAGGMGAVYESYQTTVKRPVAIKVLLMSLMQDADVAARFNREIELTARMEHPHIIPIYDHGVDGRISYIVMRLLPGGTLESRLKQSGMFTPDNMLKVITPIASGLDYAHRNGVVHRDLKPGNILFDNDNNAYLSDFGIARFMEAQTKITQSGFLVGTPAYMAPEQWRGEGIDARTDIYALGVLIFQMLSGEMPFSAPTPFAMMHKHLNEMPPPIDSLRSNLPVSLRHVVNRALAKDPQQRYQSAEALMESLKDAVAGRSVEDVIVQGETAVIPPQATTPAVPTARQSDETAATIVDSPESQRQRTSDNRRFTRWQGGLLALLMIGAVLAGLFVLFGSGDDNQSLDVSISATPALTITSAALAQQSTATMLPTALPTITEAVILPPTETSLPTALPTVTEAVILLPTETSLPTATEVILSPTHIPLTATSIPTATAEIPSATAIPSATETEVVIPTATPTMTLTIGATTIPPITPLPSGLTGGGISSNQQWTPIERVLNGVPMVLVPAGSYTMGASDAQYEQMMALCEQRFDAGTCENLLTDERQQITMTIEEPFWIDKTEVTRAVFSGSGTDTYPQTNLDWLMAQQHCESRGGRLPTEVEWEYAARGPDNRIFTWGNAWDTGSRVNICDTNCASNWRDTAYDDSYPSAAPVGSYPAGASWVGALDMGGNVWEWTSTIYRNYPYNAEDGRENMNNASTRRTLRGGSWTWIAAEVTTTARATHISAGPYTTYYGFRCVRSFTPADLTNGVHD